MSGMYLLLVCLNSHLIFVLFKLICSLKSAVKREGSTAFIRIRAQRTAALDNVQMDSCICPQCSGLKINYVYF